MPNETIARSEQKALTRQRLLRAAARLFAQRGFAAVGIADIAAELAMTGPSIYRHFDSKTDLLVAICESVVDRVTTGARLRSGLSDAALLESLIDDQIAMVLDDRDVLQIYLRELAHVPRDAIRRMRKKQRIYFDLWVETLTRLRPERSAFEQQSLVHAAIGAIHSAGQYLPGLPRPELERLLRHAAHRIFE